MEGDLELASDQLGHAASGPKVGGETVAGRFLSQPLADLLVLAGAEVAGSARRGFGSQAHISLGAMPSHPLGDGDRVHAESDGHGSLRLATQNLLNCTAAYGFENGSRSFASHRGRIS